MIKKLVINVIIIAGLIGIHATSAGVPGTELYLVSAARTQGDQGSQWYTKARIHNLYFPLQIMRSRRANSPQRSRCFDQPEPPHPQRSLSRARGESRSQRK